MNLRHEFQFLGAPFYSAIFGCLVFPHLASCQSNVVVIVSDDAGWADFGFMRNASSSADPGSSGVVPTPNLDAIAARGVTFTDAYAATICSHSRAMISTGKYSTRFGYSWNINNSLLPIDLVTAPQGLPTEANTIWEHMQGIGYDTAVVGKWHLGMHSSGVSALGNRPEHQGVEFFQGLWSGVRAYIAGEQLNPIGQLREVSSDGSGNVTNESIIEFDYPGQYVTDVFGDQSADYIKSKAGEIDPFFLYSSFTAPHDPLIAIEDDLAFIDSLNEPAFTGDRRTYAAMMHAMDRNVGKILDALEDPLADGTDPGNDSDSILDDTLIIFINDNGGNCCFANANAADNGELRLGKGHQFEGGVRVPMIVAGAGVDVAKWGTANSDLAHAIDILPTAVVGAGGGSIDPSESLDGKNLLPYINGTNQSVAHQNLFLPVYQGNRSAVRMGQWKLIYQDTTGYQLYDLDADIGEQFNRASNPAYADTLRDALLLMASYHVQTDKSRFDNQAPFTNQFDHFQFQEQAFSSATFGTTSAWTNGETEIGSFTAGWRDGYPNNELTFRAKADGDYTATNDLKSFGGFGYMVNKLNLDSASVSLNTSQSAVINGLSLMLTKSLEGTDPEMNLYSSDSTAGLFTFNVDLDLEIYDDLKIQGDGNQVFSINGGLSEFREGRSIVKTGTSSLTLAGGVDISGNFDLLGGKLALTNEGFRGDLNSQIGTRILIGGGGFQEVSGLQLSMEGDFLQAPGAMLEIDLLDTLTYDAMDITGIAEIHGDLKVSSVAGFSPSVGDTYTILSATDGLSGEFDTVILPEMVGLSWSVEYTPSDVKLRVLLAGDFNFDGSIDALDFLAWQRNPTLGNLADWEANYGTPSTANTATVPEPSGFVMVMAAVSFGLVRRRRPPTT